MCNSSTTVLLHGFMGTALNHFGAVIKYWYKNYPLLAIDLPGHGKISPDAEHEFYQQCISHVLNRIKKNQKVNLIGLSYLGGIVATRISIEYPEKIATLVLSGFTYDVPAQTFIAWTNGFTTLINENPTLATEYTKLHGERWQKTIRALINDVVDHYSQKICINEEQLKKIKIPCLLINGDFKESEVKAALTINKLIPHLHGRIIPSAGHIVTQTQPILFCQHIEKFWRNYGNN